MPSTAEDEKANDYTIAAVDRAMALLEILGRIGPASLADLAREADCTRTGAFRLLRTMRARGFVVQDGPRGQWRLGARLEALRQSAAEQDALAVTATDFMEALARRANEVIYLVERKGLQLRVSAIARPDTVLPLYAEKNSLLPLHAGSGRLLLAFAADAIQTQVLSSALPRHTPATITDRRRIASDLVRLRERGWLITESEVVSGTVSVTAPVRDATGLVTAGLSLVGPAFRLRGARARQLLPMVQEAALNLSRMLGWNDRRAPSPSVPER